MKALRTGLILSMFAIACGAAGNADEDVATGDEAALTEVDTAKGEKLEPNEEATVKQIADAASQQVLQSKQNDPQHIARRDAHPKAHGCVTASFNVFPNVPADMRVGTFQPGKHYDAWVRFSNGSNADDTKNDARGMAIKVLGASGARLLAGEEATAHTHDLVLSNHHTFFISNLQDYVGFMNTVTQKGNPLSFFIGWNPLDWHLRSAFLANKFTTQPISSPLTSRYWSVTPYALGEKVVKYAAYPCGGADTSGEHANDPNFLGTAMKAGLAQPGGACFEFAIQRRGSDMSVEDSTVTWSEDESPFVPVARLTIPQQSFDSPEQIAHCENLSFSPWHGTTEHRPLGSLNRTRKVVYEATSAARHKLNGAPRKEPTSLDLQ